MTVLKGLKINRISGAESLVNEFLKYGGYEVSHKLPKIMSMMLEKS